MNWIAARSFRIALAGLAVAGLYCSAAGAAAVRTPGAQDMDHWYGRAGGLAGSDEVDAARNARGQALGVGVPGNSGSLIFSDVQGIQAAPNVRTNEPPVEVGLPGNSGSLLFNDQNGIRSKPNIRPDEETAPTAATSQREPTEH